LQASFFYCPKRSFDDRWQAFEGSRIGSSTLPVL